MKIFGFIPARMAASRFPGKPLHPLLGRPMLEHVYRRADLFKNWQSLSVCTCDIEIFNFCEKSQMPVQMTSKLHTRAMDRVAEAAKQMDTKIAEDDLIVMVQGDEPMLKPDMIQTVVAPLLADVTLGCSVLAMSIEDHAVWLNPDTVKIIHNLKGRVLYTSRAPVPYAKTFHKTLGAKRIYGIFGFRKSLLYQFTQLPPSPLELAEACDTNRMMDFDLRQVIAPYPCIPSFSVDSPQDAAQVEAHMQSDPLWGSY